MPIILSAPAKRKNGARRDVLSEDARKSGYYVATYSPGDGKTRYRFFDLADMARRGVSTAEQDYFGPLNGIHTAVGLAAAKKFLNAPAKRKNTRAPRLGGVEATYMGRVAGRSLAVDGMGVEYTLDPEAVAEKGLRKGDTVVVRAVPGHFATFRKTVTRKNTRKASLPPMRNNGSRSTTAAEIKEAVLAGADGSYLTDVARAPALRGVHFARIEAAAEALAKAGKVSYDGITVTRKNGRKAPARRNGSRSMAEVLQGSRIPWASMTRAQIEAVVQDAAVHGDTDLVRRARAALARKAPARRNGSRSTVDPVAARELELYIENEANLVGPGNSLGANIMRMLAGRIVRGTYDSTKAWRAWVPLTTEGAKRYKREIGPINASKATRDAVATRLSEAFESEVRSGGIDPMKLLGKR
jgi:hypothetical protein